MGPQQSPPLIHPILCFAFATDVSSFLCPRYSPQAERCTQGFPSILKPTSCSWLGILCAYYTGKHRTLRCPVALDHFGGFCCHKIPQQNLEVSFGGSGKRDRMVFGETFPPFVQTKQVFPSPSFGNIHVWRKSWHLQGSFWLLSGVHSLVLCRGSILLKST